MEVLAAPSPRSPRPSPGFSCDNIINSSHTCALSAHGCTPPSDQRRPVLNPAIDRFHELTQNAAQVQSELLRTILDENWSCEYLRQFNVGPDQNVDEAEYRRLLPLTTYADLRPYMDRIAAGEPGSIITAEPIQSLCLSSGTTDTREKYLPYHEGLRRGTLEIAQVASAFRDREFRLSENARILEFLFCGKFFTTSGGIKAGTASTHLIRGEAFRQRQKLGGLRPCSPEDVVLGSDCKQVMYCHLLCGAIHASEVEVLSAPFAYTLVEALRTLEKQWREICRDISSGTLNSKITDPELRDAMAQKLQQFKDNRQLAQHAAGTFSEKCEALEVNGWKRAIPALWPRCRYVLSIMTGAMAPYVEKLRHYGGDRVPLVGADYAATEGWIGVNVNPRGAPPAGVSFTVLPTLAYFEFIPVTRPKEETGRSFAAAFEDGNPVRLTDVEVGCEYEIVMTTRWGLYRYRLGDVVRVTGFYNNCPQVSYVCRKNVVLSVNIDKNTEKDLEMVVNKATKRLQEISGDALELVDYTSHADLTSPPGHYVVFWEIKANCLCREPSTIFDDLDREPSTDFDTHLPELHTWLTQSATLMDNAFVEPGYVVSRKMNTIAPLELRIVAPGTFSKLLDRFLSKGSAAITQYKTPRCIVNPESLSLLRNNTIATFFSSNYQR